ncbi:MAG: DNA cytosine methyltransferase [Bacteroidales bacterium]|nr:DNA cytosine methyltransferase [Bacteroidales bacterium]
MGQNKGKYVLSLFSSAGIGDLGVKASGFEILICNELLLDRCALYRENYPKTEVICGDIWQQKDNIVNLWGSKDVDSPFMIYATPPCQGMSFNGLGKILAEIRSGRRPKEDPRNRLIIPTLDVVKSLRPEWLLLENVQTMKDTIIRTERNEYKNLIDYIKEELSPEYVGKAEVVNCADYGIPQSRVRLITIFTRTQEGKNYLEKMGSFLPPKSHSEIGENGLPKWITLRDSIGNLAPLSAEIGKNIDASLPWHCVPIMKPEKFWWVKNTPYNETAYNNQCVSCGYNGNRRHGMCMDEGRHQSKKDTPIYCEKCGELLPRPSMVDKNTGERRLIKGFDSAYRRMVWDLPSPTLTQNFQYEASDKKIHPEQNRVLSIYEGLVIQTISKYKYKFSINGKTIKPTLCCEIIGESVPPKLIELICNNIKKISKL